MKRTYLISALVVVIGAALLFALMRMRAEAPPVATPSPVAAAPVAPAPTAPSAVAPSPVVPSAQPTKNEKVEALTELSGAKTADALAQKGMQDELFRHLDEKALRPLQPLMEKMKAGGFLADYKKALSDNFSDAEIDRLLQIYKDPKLKELLTARDRFEIFQETPAMEKFKREFKFESLPADRREVLTRIMTSFMKIETPTPEHQVEELQPNARALELTHDAFLLQQASVEDMRHLESLISDPIFIRERHEQARISDEMYKDYQRAVGMVE